MTSLVFMGLVAVSLMVWPRFAGFLLGVFLLVLVIVVSQGNLP